jgi:non-homologous end joining protein Ku
MRLPNGWARRAITHHIVRIKSGHFNPQKFEDRYEIAPRELLKRKQAGEEAGEAERAGSSDQPDGRRPP